jgi:hypothetical protein
VIGLESGDLQPDALRLIRRSGYRQIPCWGAHPGPHDLCFEKELQELPAAPQVR